MIRSIRQTLTWWYIGILAVILIFFGLALYTSVATSLAGEVDRTLTSTADTVASTVFAFRDAEAAATHAALGNWQGAPPASFFDGIQRGQLSDLLVRWARKTSVLETDQPIRLLDTAGHPLVISPSFAQRDLPVTKTALAQARRRRTTYQTFRQSHERFRLVTRPVIESKRVLFFVQAAASLAFTDRSLRWFGWRLAWLIPFTLVLASSVGWFLATTALHPVDTMISQAQQISAQHLEARLPVPMTSDELQRLAVTFNAMLARLERAFRQLRQFSAAASHELRTPLTTIRGELEIALQRPRPPQEYHRVLQVYLKKVDELILIVEELLTLAHSEAVDRVMEWAPVNLSTLVRRMDEMWRKVAKAKAVRLELSAPEPVWVRGERRLLERVVANLLENAIRHTPPEGCVTLTLGADGSTASLQVQDTGPGISEELLPQLFDRFFRRQSEASAGSTGLGLGLCRWIVDAHHGRIEVASPPGQGATFTIQLPLSPPPAPAR